MIFFTTSRFNRARLALGTIGLVLLVPLAPVNADAPAPQPLSAVGSKDVGPASAACDTLEKGSSDWTACVGKANVALAGDEAFYAGYWLAKSGRYSEALDYLRLAPATDERVLTYIGFATRKLGDVNAAMPFYNRALALNPNYAVARAYLGEAFLSTGEPSKAVAQLDEIERRCGRSCAEYADLARHLAAYRG
jgi:tetratricopeptide (TPR) repeat protein